MESLGGKYAGIYTKKLKNEVVTYFISYRNFEQKVVREKIGQSPDMNKTKALKILSDKKEEIWGYNEKKIDIDKIVKNNTEGLVYSYKTSQDEEMKR